MKTKDWVYDGEYITTVHSETDDTETYDIRRTKGVLTCDCASYRFSKAPKGCKHLTAYTQAATSPNDVRVKVTVQHKGKTETLVVGRSPGDQFLGRPDVGGVRCRD